jgi:hypothetical protein
LRDHWEDWWADLELSWVIEVLWYMLDMGCPEEWLGHGWHINLVGGYCVCLFDNLGRLVVNSSFNLRFL